MTSGNNFFCNKKISVDELLEISLRCEPSHTVSDTQEAFSEFKRLFTPFGRSDGDRIFFDVHSSLKFDIHIIASDLYMFWYYDGVLFMVSRDNIIFTVLHKNYYLEVQKQIVNTFGIEGEDTIYTSEQIRRDSIDKSIVHPMLQVGDFVTIKLDKYLSPVVIKVEVLEIVDIMCQDTGIKGKVTDVVFETYKNSLSVDDEIYFGWLNLLGNQEYDKIQIY